jgi:hypothetical protein
VRGVCFLALFVAVNTFGSLYEMPTTRPCAESPIESGDHYESDSCSSSNFRMGGQPPGARIPKRLQRSMSTFGDLASPENAERGFLVLWNGRWAQEPVVRQLRSEPRLTPRAAGSKD